MCLAISPQMVMVMFSRVGKKKRWNYCLCLGGGTSEASPPQGSKKPPWRFPQKKPLLSGCLRIITYCIVIPSGKSVTECLKGVDVTTDFPYTTKGIRPLSDAKSVRRLSSQA